MELAEKGSFEKFLIGEKTLFVGKTDRGKRKKEKAV